jgi:glyoxylase-like metal-dependent hydrolase (beta-lactamase superfamily II)
MEAFELAPDLWRWTGRRDTIGAEVSCVYYKTGAEILLFDPLLPPEDPDGFWRALDRDVLPGDTVHVLITRPGHTRSARDVLARYPGARLWATDGIRGAVEERAETVTDAIEAGAELAGGVVAYATGRPDEVVFWIPEHRALVAGDVLVGDGHGGVELVPEKWLPPGLDHGRLADALRPLLELDVAFVIPSHGEPPDDAAAALRAAL